ncbi:MAG: hypothetical protein ACE5EM_09450 [Sphingomonadales bacterium]
MGAFFLVRGSERSTVSTVTSTARKLFEKQGFEAPKSLVTAHAELLLFPKQVAPVANYYDGGENEFCAATGTFIYKGQIGTPALKAFHADFDPARIPLGGMYGAFCVIVAKAGRLHLFTDRLGVYKVYVDSDRRMFSSSFLGLAGALRRRVIEPRAVYEYVFQGATYGQATVLQGIEQADCDQVYHIGKRLTCSGAPRALPVGFEHGSIDFHLERNLENLRRFYRTIARCFPGGIDTALSGGYDSRLTLALLRDQSVSAKVHVYGGQGDADVRVARNIASGEGFELVHVDKGGWPRPAPAGFADIVDRNFQAFDGYPADGIFDPGADLETRRSRCRNGELMLNGGGGEVFRNFFYLPNRPFLARHLVWAFYSGFDPRTCRTRYFSERDYCGGLSDKIKRVLGVDNGMLTRPEIELLYPIFRCRYWMGRNNSVNNRLGPALTPFIDHQVVGDAVKIPLEYKNYGLFEGRMIRALDPKLASYPSAYGHDFASGPTLGHKLYDLATLWRPAPLRRYAYRVQARCKPWRRPFWLEPPYLDAALPDGFPVMNRFFDMNALRDPTQLARAATLEYLFQAFNADPPET